MNKKVFIIAQILISLIAGLVLLISPEKIHPIALQIVGVFWIIESVEYLFKLITLYLNNK